MADGTPSFVRAAVRRSDSEARNAHRPCRVSSGVRAASCARDSRLRQRPDDRRARAGRDGDGAIDAVTHTDGLDISSDPLPGLSAGVLVVQDDGNPRSGVDQNFKLVDWRAEQAALAPDPAR
jgi:hypothetical protein